MPRHSGRRGKIKAQAGSSLVPNELMVVDPINARKFCASNGLWDRSDPAFPCVEPDGLLSGGIVTPGAVADTLEVAAGVVQIGGEQVAFVAATTAAIGRPALAGEVRITSVHVDDTGTVTATTGITGAPGGARGAAGGPPFVPVDEVQIAEITLTDTVSAVIVQSEIDLQAAERAAIPGFKIDYCLGCIEYFGDLPAIHTGSTVRKTYVTYRFVLLQDVGDLFDWSLDIATNQIETSAFQDLWTENVPGMKNWSGSFNGYFVSPYWFDQAVEDDAYWYIELFDDSNTDNRFTGFANLDWSVSVARDASVNETVTFTGNGPLKRLGSPSTCP